MDPSVLLVFFFSATMIAVVAFGSTVRFRHRTYRRAKVSILAVLAIAIVLCIGYRAYFGRMVSLMQNDEPPIH